jgi:iron complex transport system ATP-binding protein
MSLLQIEQLTLRQRGRTLIGELSLQIDPGQCWVVLGRNGSGKSSLLRALAGISQADSGRILLHGQAIGSQRPRLRARQLGLVFQHSQAGFHSTTLEMALSGGYPHRAGWGFEDQREIERARQALQAVGLDHLAAAPLESLSGGELRRTEIARLLVQAPNLAMLDEPLNHLDLGQQVAMLSLLRQRFCSERHALLLVLHDINLACRVASHLLLLKGDGNWLAGSVRELADAKTLGDALDYPLREVRTPHGDILEVDYPLAGLDPVQTRD